MKKEPLFSAIAFLPKHRKTLVNKGKIPYLQGFIVSGPDGSRTRVQEPIPCSSTIIVRSFSFPPSCGNEHPQNFSSP